MMLPNKISLQNLFDADVFPVGRLSFELAVLAATHFTVAVTPVQLSALRQQASFYTPRKVIMQCHDTQSHYCNIFAV